MSKEQTAAISYSKASVLASKKYEAYKDVFAVVLTDEAQYTEKELEALKSQFLNKAVKEIYN